MPRYNQNGVTIKQAIFDSFSETPEQTLDQVYRDAERRVGQLLKRNTVRLTIQREKGAGNWPIVSKRSAGESTYTFNIKQAPE
jgi:hypothetical protein